MQVCCAWTKIKIGMILLISESRKNFAHTEQPVAVARPSGDDPIAPRLSRRIVYVYIRTAVKERTSPSCSCAWGLFVLGSRSEFRHRDLYAAIENGLVVKAFLFAIQKVNR